VLVAVPGLMLAVMSLIGRRAKMKFVQAHFAIYGYKYYHNGAHFTVIISKTISAIATLFLTLIRQLNILLEDTVHALDSITY
jgi:hypothetical protein